MLILLSDTVFFFQAEDGIRDLVRSRGLGDVYKRQDKASARHNGLCRRGGQKLKKLARQKGQAALRCQHCLLYTSDAADDLPCVDLGGRRIIKKQQLPLSTIHKQHRYTDN